MDDKCWQAVLEVDKPSIKYNIQKIKEYIGCKVDIMPVIKDEGYKTNLDIQLGILNECNIKIVGVAILDEAIKLRNIGYTGEISILNQVYKEDILNVAKYDITLGIGSIDFLEELGKYTDKIFKIHLEIDTGMGRTGIPFDKTEEFIKKTKMYPNIKLEGLYTHFSCSDTDRAFTLLQIERFNNAKKIADSLKVKFKYIHCCNSAGIINFKEAHESLVRPGIILYGYLPDDSLKGKIDLKPALKLKSKISFIKYVMPNDTISYNKTYIAKTKRKIATVQLGYADGIRRCMSNKGKVVVRGMVAPIVGTICMDCFMVDVTDIPSVCVEDDVYIWDNDLIKVEDIAKIYDTINYEVIASISGRIKRVYIDK